MQRDEVLKVMTFSLRVGEEMLESAVATSDVEDAIRRLTITFGLERCEVSVTLNVITLSYLHPSLDGPITLVKVIDFDDPRFDQLVALDQLTRQVQAGELDIDQATRALREIEHAGPAHPEWVTSVAALVSAAGWVVFAGGGLVGAAAGVLAALVIELVVRPVTRQRLPSYFVVSLSAVCAVSFPMAFAWGGLPIALTPAIVGGLYPLLPGGALVASVTDGLSGAPLSSMAKGLQATVSAAAIALGAFGVLTLSERLGITSDVVATPAPTIVGLLSAAVAVGSFGVARSLPFRYVPGTMLVAVVVFGANVIADDPDALLPFATFVAAIVLGLGGQLAARLQHTTATIHTATAVYVLVPGVLTYLSMLAFAQGDADAGLELLTRAVGVAGAIAAGVALGTAAGRSVRTPRPRVVLWRRHSRR